MAAYTQVGPYDPRTKIGVATYDIKDIKQAYDDLKFNGQEIALIRRPPQLSTAVEKLLPQISHLMFASYNAAVIPKYKVPDPTVDMLKNPSHPRWGPYVARGKHAGKAAADAAFSVFGLPGGMINLYACPVEQLMLEHPYYVTMMNTFHGPKWRAVQQRWRGVFPSTPARQNKQPIQERKNMSKKINNKQETDAAANAAADKHKWHIEGGYKGHLSIISALYGTRGFVYCKGSLKNKAAIEYYKKHHKNEKGEDKGFVNVPADVAATFGTLTELHYNASEYDLIFNESCCHGVVDHPASIGKFLTTFPADDKQMQMHIKSPVGISKGYKRFMYPPEFGMITDKGFLGGLQSYLIGHLYYSCGATWPSGKAAFPILNGQACKAGNERCNEDFADVDKNKNTGKTILHFTYDGLRKYLPTTVLPEEIFRKCENLPRFMRGKRVVNDISKYSPMLLYRYGFTDKYPGDASVTTYTQRNMQNHGAAAAAALTDDDDDDVPHGFVQTHPYTKQRMIIASRKRTRSITPDSESDDDDDDDHDHYDDGGVPTDNDSDGSHSDVAVDDPYEDEYQDVATNPHSKLNNPILHNNWSSISYHVHA